MINYLISYTDEERAMMELAPFGHAVIIADPTAPAGGEVIYGWNQGTAMLGSAGIILSYKASSSIGAAGESNTVNVPTFVPGYWVSLLSPEPDEALWEQMSANYPSIEFGPEGVLRTANLDFDLATIKGITPMWAGAPDMGWPYEEGLR